MGQVTRYILAGVVLVAGAAGAWAAANDKGEGRGERSRVRGEGSYLKRLDADNDLAVTMEEYLKRRTARFQRADGNGDGALDEAELLKGALRGGGRMGRMMKRLDQDADGRLTRAELERDGVAPAKADGAARFAAVRSPERRLRLFTSYDRNADGVVDKTEYESLSSEEQDYRRRKALHVLDRNGDGKVTIEEFTADARSRFERLDLDRDGRITAADLPPAIRPQWTAR